MEEEHRRHHFFKETTQRTRSFRVPSLFSLSPWPGGQSRPFFSFFPPFSRFPFVLTNSRRGAEGPFRERGKWAVAWMDGEDLPYFSFHLLFFLPTPHAHTPEWCDFEKLSVKYGDGAYVHVRVIPVLVRQIIRRWGRALHRRVAKLYVFDVAEIVWRKEADIRNVWKRMVTKFTRKNSRRRQKKFNLEVDGFRTRILFEMPYKNLNLNRIPHFWKRGPLKQWKTKKSEKKKDRARCYYLTLS